jgi:hypothetical protein
LPHGSEVSLPDELAPPLSVFGLSEAQKSAVNDDRIARALDALASERGRNVFFRLALRIIKDVKLKTRRIHQAVSLASQAATRGRCSPARKPH